MARGKKNRCVCNFPENLAFAPVGSRKKEAVVLSIDEYETIRLIDREGLSQEQCALHMGVSRTTVQAIYAAARKKLAIVLVEGLVLRIEGGEYQLCNGERDPLRCGGCLKYQLHQQFAKPKGEPSMRIAVTYENGQVFQHFGHTQQFKVYDVENNAILSAVVVDTQGQGHGALAGVLSAIKADVLICGGIGDGARTALDANGIKLFGGVSGSADDAVAAYLNGTLAYDPNARCDHHDHEHGQHHCGQGECHAK